MNPLLLDIFGIFAIAIGLFVASKMFWKPVLIGLVFIFSGLFLMIMAIISGY